MTRVVAINGSPRKKGNTADLIKTAFEEFEKAGYKTEMLHIGDQALIGCQACFDCRKKPDNTCKYKKDVFNQTYAKCLDADIILLGSPVYVGGMTSSMKAFIDRACIVSKANGQPFSRKIGASVVAVRRNGGLETFNSLNDFFLISEMTIVGSSYWNQGVGKDKGEVMEDEEGIRTIRKLAENIIWLRNLIETQEQEPKTKKPKKNKS